MEIGHVNGLTTPKQTKSGTVDKKASRQQTTDVPKSAVLERTTMGSSGVDVKSKHLAITQLQDQLTLAQKEGRSDDAKSYITQIRTLMGQESFTESDVSQAFQKIKSSVLDGVSTRNRTNSMELLQ